MKKKITLRRIFHRERWRYGIFFDYDSGLTVLVKKINGATWSSTNKCWHVSDDEKTLKQIISVFRESADIDISGISSGEKKIKETGKIIRSDEKDIAPITQVQITPEVRISQIKQFDDSASSHEKDVYPFHSNITENIPEQRVPWKRYGPVEFTINESDGRLIIRFTGEHDKEWVSEIKSYGRASFDTVRFEWLLDWSRLTVDSLSDYFSTRGVEVIVKRMEVSPAVKDLREEQGSEIRDRLLGSDVMNGMENVRRYLNEKRYSVNTIETYLSLLELFFKYFYPRDGGSITSDDISGFFQNYILYHNYSASYQNQFISAIKMYYSLNCSKSIDSSVLGRPRRSRTLPKVFSKEEIKSILNSTRNIKHKLLLWLIYSCGLRRSEVTNIKINDLDRERGILNIREAKGMVDRIVPVSAKVWDKIDEYTESYHPAFWLFEGQTGGRYSSESVYRVFKTALISAGIKKDVGVHSLRHSYATHLHENGLDIRYIQELLGHKSSRTTEIYTHVSRRNLVAVRSPIEDLDIK